MHVLPYHLISAKFIKSKIPIPRKIVQIAVCKVTHFVLSSMRIQRQQMHHKYQIQADVSKEDNINHAWSVEWTWWDKISRWNVGRHLFKH